MLTVMVMLSFALTWSPQYDPPPGVGGCYAQCALRTHDNSEMFAEYIPSDQSFLNNVAQLQTALFYYGYATTGLFIFPAWHSGFRYVVWHLPGLFFDGLRDLLGQITSQKVKSKWSSSQAKRIVGFFSTQTKKIWKAVHFLSPRNAIILQLFSWSFGLTMLSTDRWGRARNSVSDPGAEDQWSFGQVLAVVILFLPLFPLLEAWSGKFYSESSLRFLPQRSKPS
jgi:hypothetical protein